MKRKVVNDGMGQESLNISKRHNRGMLGLRSTNWAQTPRENGLAMRSCVPLSSSFYAAKIEFAITSIFM